MSAVNEVNKPLAHPRRIGCVWLGTQDTRTVSEEHFYPCAALQWAWIKVLMARLQRLYAKTCGNAKRNDVRFTVSL